MSLIKTPLRYPGGKQRLTPFMEEILIANRIEGAHYVEPYAGGAGLAIRLLTSGKVSCIHLNDKDVGIYAFWHSVLNKPDELCELIDSAKFSVREWRKRKAIVKKHDRRSLLTLGFSVFYLNRCNRSGILTGGVIGGVKQNGNYKMNARFNKKDLIERIRTISKYKKKIFLTNFDAEYYITNYIPNLPENSLIYLDPPYYQKGSTLYLNAYSKTDHVDLATAIQDEIDHKWVLSYDGVDEVLALYPKRKHFLYDLQYSAEKSYKGREVFIFSDSLQIPKHSSLDYINEELKGVKALVEV